MRIMHTRVFRFTTGSGLLWLPLLFVCSCYSPANSQQYFMQATVDEIALKPIYTTTLYTVYFDQALQRCIIHSAHTWGQQGGGGGGTGIGVTAFRCDPARISERAKELGMEVLTPHFRPRPEDPPPVLQTSPPPPKKRKK